MLKYWRARKLRQWLFRFSFVFMVAFSALISINHLDHMVYGYGRSEGRISDRMYQWQTILSQYQKEHDGQFPALLENTEFELPSNLLNCLKAKTPYLYFPEYVRLETGKMVVMCPHNTHGWLTLK